MKKFILENNYEISFKGNFFKVYNYFLNCNKKGSFIWKFKGLKKTQSFYDIIMIIKR